MLMLFSVLDSTKNLCFTGIKQFLVLVRTGPRFSRETRHIRTHKKPVSIYHGKSYLLQSIVVRFTAKLRPSRL